MQELVLFSLSFILIFIIYQVFVITNAKKNYKKKNGKYPIEILYLEKRYNLDMKKVKYNNLLQVVAITTSIDVSLTVSFISNVKNFFIEIFGGFIFMIMIILISYHSVYLFYRRKGMIKDE